MLNKALHILLFTNAMVLIAGAMLGPIYALFISKVGGNILEAGFAGGIFTFAAGLTTLIAGKLVDKIKEDELIIVFGYCLLGTGFLLYTFVRQVYLIFLLQVLIGIAEAIYSPAFDAVYSQHLVKDKAGSAWGAWESMNYFSLTLGAILGSIIVNYLGFNTLFIIMAVLCFLSAIYIYLLPRRIL